MSEVAQRSVTVTVSPRGLGAPTVHPRVRASITLTSGVAMSTSERVLPMDKPAEAEQPQAGGAAVGTGEPRAGGVAVGGAVPGAAGAAVEDDEPLSPPAPRATAAARLTVRFEPGPVALAPSLVQRNVAALPPSRTAPVQGSALALFSPAGDDTVRRRRDRGPVLGLTARLLLSDVAALGVGWGAALVGPVLGSGGTAIADRVRLTLLAVAVGVGLLALSRLYRAWVGTVRTMEITRLGRAAVLSGLLLVALGQAVDTPLPLGEVLAGGLAALVLTVCSRSAFRTWLRRRRVEGRHTRPVILVGTGDDAAELDAIIADHPEFGFRVAGTVGAWPASDAIAAPWLGDLDAAVAAIRGSEASGAIVVASELPAGRLTRVVRELLDADVHVHLSSGLFGIAHQRLRTLSLAHEPLHYLEQTSLARWQQVAKGGLDVGLALVLSVVTLPLVALAALAVRLEGPGPLLARHERVGMDGRPFTQFKLRTTRADRPAATPRVAQAPGAPRDEPVDDPGVTRVGAWLRALSLDELPQLLNVLAGSMSLVGPRPASPEEAADLDPHRHVRFRVRPGISGLWQVEARDNPSAGPYRRLDQFYVENWSIGLDLSILVATVATVVLGWARKSRTLLSPRG